MAIKKFCLALAVVMVCCQARLPESAASERTKEVASGVFAITGLGFTNCGFIVTEQGVVVVDTQLIPLMAREIIQEVKAVTDKPIIYAINTHWHTDHVGGNEAFSPPARIISHEFTREIIARRRKEQDAGTVDESLKQLGDFKLVPPDITFSQEMSLHLGDKIIQLMFFGGGHTGGDIVVYLPREKVLFSGDIFIIGSGLPDYRDDSNVDKLIASLKKIQSLDSVTIVCGHTGIAQKKDIQGSIDKLTAFRAQVQKYVDANLPPEKAAGEITFPEGENPFYKQHFGEVIHKVYRDIKQSRQ